MSYKHQPITQTTRPIVTGTSVIAIRTKSFVMMAADTLGSYGSLSRFHDIKRIINVGDNTILGAGGEISDFQKVTQFLQQLELKNKSLIYTLYHIFISLHSVSKLKRFCDFCSITINDNYTERRTFVMVMMNH